MGEVFTAPGAGGSSGVQVYSHRLDPGPVIADQVEPVAPIGGVIARHQDDTVPPVTADDAVVQHRGAQIEQVLDPVDRVLTAEPVFADNTGR